MISMVSQQKARAPVSMHLDCLHEGRAVAMHQDIAGEFEALEHLRWAVAQLGFVRAVRGLAAVKSDSLTTAPFPLELAQEGPRADEMVVEDLAGDIKKLSQQRITHRVADRRSILACSHDIFGAEDRELLRDE